MNARYQKGVTLVEAMISLSLSLIVTMGMVALMANSLGTANRIIQMSQLTDEMRNALSIMTRDVRRANYSVNSIYCYGNSNCGNAGGIAEQAGDITVVNTAAFSCFVFNVDREFDGDTTTDPAGGFRRLPHPDSGVGVIQMWTGDQSADCVDMNYSNENWVDLTDPGTVDITQFIVDDTGSLTQNFLEGETNDFSQTQRQLRLDIVGELVLEQGLVTAGMFADQVVSRQIGDIIYVRNDFIDDPI
jgi:Tfp pilus assembly protein PilV